MFYGMKKSTSLHAFIESSLYSESRYSFYKKEYVITTITTFCAIFGFLIDIHYEPLFYFFIQKCSEDIKKKVRRIYIRMVERAEHV